MASHATKGLFINCAHVWNVHELWLITAFIHLVCDLVDGSTAPVDPLSHSVGSRVKPLFVAWTTSMDSIVPAVFATGVVCLKWSADFGLSVTSRLLDSLMKFLRAGRSVRLWINLDANTPDYKRPISQTIASVLMRRRSLQLLSRLRTISEFPWILRAVDCRRQQSHVAVETSSRIFWNFNDCFRTESRFRLGRVLWSCCHHINNYCVRFNERQSGVR